MRSDVLGRTRELTLLQIKGLFGEELGFALLCEYFRREGCVALRQK
jgi:hypothetical protein